MSNGEMSLDSSGNKNSSAETVINVGQKASISEHASPPRRSEENQPDSDASMNRGHSSRLEEPFEEKFQGRTSESPSCTCDSDAVSYLSNNDDDVLHILNKYVIAPKENRELVRQPFKLNVCCDCNGYK